MKAKGKAFKYGDNVDTDVIIPARYLNTPDASELADHCMEDIDDSFTARVVCRATDWKLRHLEVMPEAARDRVQNLDRLGDDFRPHAVTGQNCDLRFHAFFPFK